MTWNLWCAWLSNQWHSIKHQGPPYHVNDTAPILVMGYRDSSLWDLDLKKNIAEQKHINRPYIRVLASTGWLFWMDAKHSTGIVKYIIYEEKNQSERGLRYVMTNLSRWRPALKSNRIAFPHICRNCQWVTHQRNNSSQWMNQSSSQKIPQVQDPSPRRGTSRVNAATHQQRHGYRDRKTTSYLEAWDHWESHDFRWN